MGLIGIDVIFMEVLNTRKSQIETNMEVQLHSEIQIIKNLK